MEQHLATWWSMTTEFFQAPTALAAGTVHIPNLVATLGLTCLLVGLLLGLIWREKQVLWLPLPAVAALLAPLILTISHEVLGWVGLGFSLIAGAIGLLIWIAMIANDATKRLPVWLIGLTLLSYVGYCGLVFIAFIWGL